MALRGAEVTELHNSTVIKLWGYADSPFSHKFCNIHIRVSAVYNHRAQTWMEAISKDHYCEHRKRCIYSGHGKIETLLYSYISVGGHRVDTYIYQ